MPQPQARSAHLKAERVPERVLQSGARGGEAGVCGLARQQAEHCRPHRSLPRRAAFGQRRQLRARVLQGLLLTALLRQAAELAPPQLKEHLRRKKSSEHPLQSITLTIDLREHLALCAASNQRQHFSKHANSVEGMRWRPRRLV